ncbi:MAG TPA: M23 family metallopeptidase [Bacteroidia bacterium]|nr:M23 family metallopeptidase [Bacteroidia bacterium]
MSSVFISDYSFAQTSLTWKLFSSPLDTAIVLAGTFGEIRSNHFHSGIDIRTGGEEGKEVMAVSDGFISRIKVSAVGFGKALYITHNNGYVTVYAHLQKFNDTLDKYVKREQYKRESFEVELFPSANEFVFKQGEIIAYSGNTGGSTGPHLHFETRDTKTEEPREPLLFLGNILNDTIHPEIKSIVIYPLNKNGSVNSACQKLLVPLVLRDKIFSDTTTQKIVVNGEIGFGIETYDKQIHEGAELGIKRIELFIDDKMIYDYSIERFRFDETKFVNANIDYAETVGWGKTIILCYRLPGNDFRVTFRNELQGILNFNSEASHEVLFHVYDFNNNISQASFYFTSASEKVSCAGNIPNDSTFLISYDKPFIHEGSELKISSDKLPVVYDNIYVTITKRGQEKNHFSKTFVVGADTIPVHNAITLSIKANNLPKAMRDKALIVKIDKDGNVTSAGGSFANGFVTSKIRSFGNYAVAVDTVPPEIKATNLSTRGKDAVIKFKIKISDDLSGIATYRATLNKKWMLFEYDAKTGTLSGEEKVEKKNTTYNFKLVVSDKKGNRSTYSATMKY